MEIIKASPLKRICAAMVDFILSLVLGMLIANFVFTPIANKTAHLDTKQAEYREELFDLGVIVLTKTVDKDIVIAYDYSSNKEDVEAAKNNKDYQYAYITSVTINDTFKAENFEFYVNHIYEAISDSSYYIQQKKDNTKLFDYNEETNVATFKADASSDDKVEWITSMYNGVTSREAFKNYHDGKIIKLSSDINMTSRIISYSAMLVAIFLFYFVIPLLLKDGQTLGKKCLALGVVNKADGFAVTNLNLFIRFLSFFVIEYLLSSFLMYGPLLISLIVMILNKKGQSIHDLLARTMVVDKNTYIIYKNQEEYNVHLEKENNIVNAEVNEVETQDVTTNIESHQEENKEEDKETSPEDTSENQNETHQEENQEPSLEEHKEE